MSAAGILFVCPATSRMLLGLRSATVRAPHVWSVVGGSIEPGESPERAAVREAREEVGYHGPIALVPSLVYVRLPHFRYYNFIGIVPSEFRPTLNHEHDDARWFYPDRPPHPLHHGTQLLLEKSHDQIVRVASGMYRSQSTSGL